MSSDFIPPLSSRPAPGVAKKGGPAPLISGMVRVSPQENQAPAFPLPLNPSGRDDILGGCCQESRASFFHSAPTHKAEVRSQQWQTTLGLRCPLIPTHS